MLSPEFKEAVGSRNILRTKIMIKDAFVTDPTCALVDEMLQYVKSSGLEIIEPYDGGTMKKFSSEWNRAVLNDELVKLVDNFSEDRIRNLRLMVKKVIGVPGNAIDNVNVLDRNRKIEKRREALIQMTTAGRNIQTVLARTKLHKWSPKDVNDMEKEATKILDAVRQYNDNLPTKR